MAETVTEDVASESLGDHEQSFHGAQAPPPAVPDPAATADPAEATTDDQRDPSGRFKPKHRAKSQQATPADTPRIAELTRRRHEAEERATAAEARAAELERRLTAPREPVKAALPVPEATPETFTEKEPAYEDFADAPDQYAAHLRAVAAWDRRKEAFEAKQAAAQDQGHQAIAERNAKRDAWFAEQETAHAGRMKAYHEAHPEAQDVLDAAGDVQLTPAAYMAVMTAENGPDLLMRLASDEVLRDDVFDLTEGKPLSRDLVARVQRRLNRGLTAGTTGAAQRPQPKAVPRPPTPVRTAPMQTGDSVPDDESSLAAHEGAFFRRSIRRR